MFLIIRGAFSAFLFFIMSVLIIENPSSVFRRIFPSSIQSVHSNPSGRFDAR